MPFCRSGQRPTSGQVGGPRRVGRSDEHREGNRRHGATPSVAPPREGMLGRACAGRQEDPHEYRWHPARGRVPAVLEKC